VFDWPRETYAAREHFRAFARPDDAPVRPVVCFSLSVAYAGGMRASAC
jgi:hypothetical protein